MNPLLSIWGNIFLKVICRPYIGLWDNKPPLLFYIFALLIKISFHNIALIRLIGAIIIGITGGLCFTLLGKLHSRIAGFYSGLFYIVYSSADSWTYSVFSDHLCAPLILIAYLVFLSTQRSYWQRAAMIGFLIGICAMIQTNYWVLALFFALMQLSWFYPFTYKTVYKGIIHGALLGLYSAIPFLIFGFIYALHNQTELFWRSLVTAELGHVRINIHDGLLSIVADKFWIAYIQWLSRIGSPDFLPFALYLFALLVWFTPFVKMTKRNRITFFIFLMGVTLSSGMRAIFVNLPPQILCLILCISLTSGIILSQIITRRNILAILIILCSLHIAIRSSYPEYGGILKKLADKRPLQDDLYYRIASTINHGQSANPYIYTCETEQILYYLTNSQVPLLIAHAHIMSWGFLPNMAYGHTVTMKDMFGEIKAHHPAYIIAPEKHFCFNLFGDDYMKDYRLLYQIDNKQLWQLKE